MWTCPSPWIRSWQLNSGSLNYFITITSAGWKHPWQTLLRVSRSVLNDLQSYPQAVGQTYLKSCSKNSRVEESHPALNGPVCTPRLRSTSLFSGPGWASQLHISICSILALLPSPPCFPWEENLARKERAREQNPGAHLSMCLWHILTNKDGTQVTGKLLLCNHQLCKLGTSPESHTLLISGMCLFFWVHQGWDLLSEQVSYSGAVFQAETSKLVTVATMTKCPSLHADPHPSSSPLGWLFPSAGFC